MDCRGAGCDARPGPLRARPGAAPSAGACGSRGGVPRVEDRHRRTDAREHWHVAHLDCRRARRRTPRRCVLASGDRRGGGPLARLGLQARNDPQGDHASCLRLRLCRGRAQSREVREPEPPSAEQVEAVYRLLPSKHRLALLWLDWSGARVSSIDTIRVGDYDEPRRRVRLRAAASKTGRALWVELPDILAEAIELTLPPREDRDPEARLFASSGADSIRTSIAKACRAAGIPLWSPHDLRHRRISLLHRQGRTWAEIGALVGQRSLKVTSDTYTHVLIDGRELDYAALLARA